MSKKEKLQKIKNSQYLVDVTSEQLWEETKEDIINYLEDSCDAPASTRARVINKLQRRNRDGLRADLSRSNPYRNQQVIPQYLVIEIFEEVLNYSV